MKGIIVVTGASSGFGQHLAEVRARISASSRVATEFVVQDSVLILSLALAWLSRLELFQQVRK